MPLAVLAACGSRYTGTPASSAQPVAFEAPTGPHYRLAMIGIARPEGQSLELVRGTSSCCSEIRAGWLVERGPYWVAVDTVTKRIEGPDHAISFHAAGPFFIRVDSGPVARTPRGDSLFFTSSVSPGVIPAAATVGVRRGDTLTLTSDNRRLGYPVDFARVYVLVR